MGREVSPRIVFEAPTVAALAARLATPAGEPDPGAGAEPPLRAPRFSGVSAEEVP
jgi:hypothetical protein